MNPHLLNPEVQAFILEHLQADPISLLLKKSPFPHVSSKELVEQIESKKRSWKKLPTWFKTNNIYYPNKLNLSQTSSEITANYKAGIVQGKRLIDLTGGFGVDSFFFGKKISKVVHIEKNASLSKIAQHNFKALQANNLTSIDVDGIQYLKDTNDFFDWIYIDPSRRTDAKEKVFFLSDCEPDVTNHLDLFFSKSNNILIKTGPLLDINAGIQQLNHIKEIHLVAVKNELKEILWVLQKDNETEPLIRSIHFNKENNEVFDFKQHEEASCDLEYAIPQQFLYEPNVAIMKSGAFKLIAIKFGLKKLHQHSHLYTAETLKKFPGRTFKIEQIIPYGKKSIRELRIKKANITIRNFPYSVAIIRKNTSIKDGGEVFLFFTTDYHNKLIVLKCNKVESPIKA